MGRSFPIGLAAFVVLSSTPAAAQQPVVAFTPAEIQWGDGPALLPRGVKAARLQRSPADPGPFTVRLKLPAGYKLGPHWHPRDELVTVLTGTVLLMTLYAGSTLDYFVGLKHPLRFRTLVGVGAPAFRRIVAETLARSPR